MGKLAFLGNILNRQSAPNPVKEAMIINSAAQAASRTDDDVAWKEQQGTNYELIHDDPMEAVLNEMMHDRAIVYNEEKKEYQVIANALPNLNMIGLRMVASHVNRCSFNEKSDVAILKPKLRAMTKLVKMQMRPDTFNLGMSTFLAGFEYANIIALNDSVEGKKSKLLKTIPKITSVEVSAGELPKSKGSGGFYR